MMNEIVDHINNLTPITLHDYQCFIIENFFLATYITKLHDSLNSINNCLWRNFYGNQLVSLNAFNFSSAPDVKLLLDEMFIYNVRKKLSNILQLNISQSYHLGLHRISESNSFKLTNGADYSNLTYRLSIFIEGSGDSDGGIFFLTHDNNINDNSKVKCILPQNNRAVIYPLNDNLYYAVSEVTKGYIYLLNYTFNMPNKLLVKNNLEFSTSKFFK